MNLTQAQILMAQVEKACESVGAHVEITQKKKPRLEHIKIEINAKVEETQSGRN